MNRPLLRRTLPALAIVAVVLLCWLAFSSPKQRTYGGQTVAYWTQLLWAGTRAEKLAAAETIRSLDTNAVPELARMLLADDSELKRQGLDILSKQNVLPRPYLDRDFDQQRLALKAAFVLGKSARPLVPTLQRVIENWTNHSLDVVFGAIEIAERFAPESTPHLLTSVVPPRLVYTTNALPGNAWTITPRYLEDEPEIFGTNWFGK